MKEHSERIYGGLSIEGKTELWARWRAGESMSDIGRALGKDPGSIYTLLLVQGGIARAPALMLLYLFSLAIIRERRVSWKGRNVHFLLTDRFCRLRARSDERAQAQRAFHDLTLN